MKKIFSILAIGALCLTSCQKAELVQNGVNEGTTTFIASLESTKIAMGDKVGLNWKAVWETGDQLTVTNASTKAVIGTATLATGAGSNKGTFTMPVGIEEGTSVVLSYGDGTIPTVQTKASASDKKLATSAVSQSVKVTGGVAADFTLTHSNAVVKVSLGSSALAGGTVSKIYFRSIGKVLSGTDSDYVEVDLTTPVTLSATAQDIFFTVKSLDLTASEIYVAPVITKGDETFTLPVGFKGKNVAANTVCAFNLGTLTEANCASWYEPHDLRLMPGEGYAYGDANCYFIQCKNGSTYTGATYTPNSNIPDKVAINYKARGDFRKVINPKEATFTWMKLGDTDPTTGTGTGSMYVTRTQNYSASGVDPTKYSFTNNASLCTVTVENTGAYAGGPILLMVKDGTVQWAWSFWNIAADGTDITPVPAKSGSAIKISPMDIGQATTQFEKWIANKNSTNPDPVYRTIFRYQWGRPIPVFWNPVSSLNIPGTANNGGNIPAVVGPLTLKESLAHPCGLIVASATETGKTITDWLSTPDGSLWGNLNSTVNNIGDKSIYDPCPKGYRVADRNTLSTLRYGVTWATNSVAGYPHYKATVTEGTDIYFIKPGYYTQTTATNSGKFAIGSMGGAVTGLCQYGIWWSNLCQTDAGYPSTMANQGETVANPGVRDNNSADVKTRVFSVRCQVDEDNR